MNLILMTTGEKVQDSLTKLFILIKTILNNNLQTNFDKAF
jgi:hypothetical protein